MAFPIMSPEFLKMAQVLPGFADALAPQLVAQTIAPVDATPMTVAAAPLPHLEPLPQPKSKPTVDDPKMLEEAKKRAEVTVAGIDTGTVDPMLNKPVQHMRDAIRTGDSASMSTALRELTEAYGAPNMRKDTGAWFEDTFLNQGRAGKAAAISAVNVRDMLQAEALTRQPSVEQVGSVPGAIDQMQFLPGQRRDIKTIPASETIPGELIKLGQFPVEVGERPGQFLSPDSLTGSKANHGLIPGIDQVLNPKAALTSPQAKTLDLIAAGTGPAYREAERQAHLSTALKNAAGAVPAEIQKADALTKAGIEKYAFEHPDAPTPDPSTLYDIKLVAHNQAEKSAVKGTHEYDVVHAKAEQLRQENAIRAPLVAIAGQEAATKFDLLRAQRDKLEQDIRFASETQPQRVLALKDEHDYTAARIEDLSALSRHMKNKLDLQEAMVKIADEKAELAAIGGSEQTAIRQMQLLVALSKEVNFDLSKPEMQAAINNITKRLSAPWKLAVEETILGGKPDANLVPTAEPLTKSQSKHAAEIGEALRKMREGMKDTSGKSD